MYTCIICHEVNHAARLHCRSCGSYPPQYSILHIPVSVNESGAIHPIVVAQGAQRANESRLQRVNLRTVPLDYYGEQ